MRYFAVVLVTALTALITTGPGHAASVRSTAAEAELVARQAAIAPGASLELGLRLKLDPQWHVYWKNAGDSGSPPSLTLELPAGLSAGPMQFGYPSRIPVAHLVNYGYEGEVLFPVHVDVPAGFTSPGAVMIRARADWLECKESCLPASADLELALPVAPSGAPGPWSALFDATRAKLPVALPAGMTTAATAGADALALDIDGLTDCANAHFFPDREGLFAHAKIARVAVTALPRLGFSLPLEGNAKAPDRLTGVLTCSAAGGPIRAYEVAAAVEAIPMNTSAVDAASLSFGLALLFAFAGGLLLNLMPCVFPVLGLKILGLAQLPQAAARIGHAARFLAGVLVSFGVLAGAMLALRAAGAQIGWGFQLQSPAFVAAIAVLFFLLALNLSGFFEWGGGIQSAAGGAGARWSGPFADGVLAAVIASPCTAPLMGAAIGFTLTQPAPILFGVFIAIALGMALPYVLLSLYPGWVRLMPKPGPWLESVRQLLAFPLYATVLWLAWVLGELAGLDATVRLGVLLLAISFGIWIGRRRGAIAHIALGAAIVLVAGSIVWLHAAMSAGGTTTVRADRDWQPWSAAAFASARAQGKPVFIDFTAAWCVSCQVNKHAVLHTTAVTNALRQTGTVALRADWTRQDPEITRALAALGRNGVPVYAVYDRSGRVSLLPEILTTARVLEALQTSATLAGAPRR